MKKSENENSREDKFTYTEEDVKALKVYKSRQHAEEENKKSGKKIIWYK